MSFLWLVVGFPDLAEQLRHIGCDVRQLDKDVGSGQLMTTGLNGRAGITTQPKDLVLIAPAEQSRLLEELAGVSFAAFYALSETMIPVPDGVQVVAHNTTADQFAAAVGVQPTAPTANTPPPAETTQPAEVAAAVIVEDPPAATPPPLDNHQSAAAHLDDAPATTQPSAAPAAMPAAVAHQEQPPQETAAVWADIPMEPPTLPNQRPANPATAAPFTQEEQQEPLNTDTLTETPSLTPQMLSASDPLCDEAGFDDEIHQDPAAVAAPTDPLNIETVPAASVENIQPQASQMEHAAPPVQPTPPQQPAEQLAQPQPQIQVPQPAQAMSPAPAPPPTPAAQTQAVAAAPPTPELQHSQRPDSPPLPPLVELETPASPAAEAPFSTEVPITHGVGQTGGRAAEIINETENPLEINPSSAENLTEAPLSEQLPPLKEARRPGLGMPTGHFGQPSSGGETAAKFKVPTPLSADLAAAKLSRESEMVRASAVASPTLDAISETEMSFASNQYSTDTTNPINGEVIAMLGAKGGIGKSTISVWLASALFACGKKVALIDGNLDHPSIGRITGLHRSKINQGISDFFNRRPTSQEIADQLVFVEGLGDVLTASETPLAHSHEEMAQALYQVVGYLRKTHDYVLIDLPPAGTDTTLFQSYALRAAAEIDRFIVILTTLNTEYGAAADWLFQMTRSEVEGGIKLDTSRCVGIINQAGRTSVTTQKLQAAARQHLNIPFLGEVPYIQEHGTLQNAGRWQAPPEVLQPLSNFVYAVFGITTTSGGGKTNSKRRRRLLGRKAKQIK